MGGAVAPAKSAAAGGGTSMARTGDRGGGGKGRGPAGEEPAASTAAGTYHPQTRPGVAQRLGPTRCGGSQ